MSIVPPFIEWTHNQKKKKKKKEIESSNLVWEQRAPETICKELEFLGAS
jgi:hypothetical protein